VTGDDPEEVDAAIEWLIEETGASEEPPE